VELNLRKRKIQIFKIGVDSISNMPTLSKYFFTKDNLENPTGSLQETHKLGFNGSGSGVGIGLMTSSFLFCLYASRRGGVAANRLTFLTSL